MSQLFADRQAQRSTLHNRYLNEQFVRVLKTIGYDVGFQKGQGQYLYDREGARYLDLLSGFGVFAIGRNHPVMRDALKSVPDPDLPNPIHFAVSVLHGVPVFLQGGAGPGRNSSVGMLTPLPWIGSTTNAATSREASAFSSAARSLNGIEVQPGSSGSKPVRKFESPVSDSAP